MADSSEKIKTELFQLTKAEENLNSIREQLLEQRLILNDIFGELIKDWRNNIEQSEISIAKALGINQASIKATYTSSVEEITTKLADMKIDLPKNVSPLQKRALDAFLTESGTNIPPNERQGIISKILNNPVFADIEKGQADLHKKHLEQIQIIINKIFELLKQANNIPELSKDNIAKTIEIAANAEKDLAKMASKEANVLPYKLEEPEIAQQEPTQS